MPEFVSCIQREDAMVTNPQSGTNVAEIAHGIYCINTPIRIPAGQPFSFNRYLVVDDEPLLFHTGPRKHFPLQRRVAVRLSGLCHPSRAADRRGRNGESQGLKALVRVEGCSST